MYAYGKTIIECLKDRVLKTPLNIAIDGDEGKLSYSKVDELSTLLALDLQNQGIMEKDKVGILSANSTNWIIVFYAVLKLNAIPVLFNFLLKKNELVDLINYSDCKYVMHCNNCDKENIIESLNHLKANTKTTYITIPKKTYDYKDFDVKDINNEDKLNYYNAKENDEALIMFTSGTSFVSKGVVLSHLNLLKNSYSVSKSMGWNEEDKFLVNVPLFHCFGTSTCLLTSLFTGHTLIITNSFHRQTSLELIEKYKVSVLNGVPSMFLAIVKYENFDKYDISSLRNGIIAGSYFSKEDYIDITNKLQNFNLISSYGQTETSPCVTITKLDSSFEEKSMFQGKVIEDVEIKIAADNEILVKGYNTTKGYYKLAEETKNLYDENGYLKTGDLGTLDNNNNLTIIGRKKDLIIRAGENIAPLEIEKHILTYPNIKECKVIGKKAEVIQEKVVACIVSSDVIDEELLKKYLSDKLAKYKIPEEYIFLDELPKTASGKISLNKLKERVNYE